MISGVYQKRIKSRQRCGRLAEELWEKNPDIILVSQEVGYGVVPMDAFDRKYREAVEESVRISHQKAKR